jgi:polyhydroxyalkanoate synthesis regulator phasin
MINSKELKTDIDEQIKASFDIEQYIEKKIIEYIEPFTEKLERTRLLLLLKIPQIDFLEAKIEEIKRSDPVQDREEELEGVAKDDLTNEQTKQIFNDLVNKWKDETINLSSMQRIISNSAYLSIIGLGPSAIPLIFYELISEPNWWFCALRSITSKDPVTEDMRGDLIAMTKAWLDWGRKHGYVRDY